MYNKDHIDLIMALRNIKLIKDFTLSRLPGIMCYNWDGHIQSPPLSVVYWSTNKSPIASPVFVICVRCIVVQLSVWCQAAVTIATLLRNAPPADHNRPGIHPKNGPKEQVRGSGQWLNINQPKLVSPRGKCSTVQMV